MGVKCAAALLSALMMLLTMAAPISAAGADIEEPEVEAAGAVLMDFDTGRVLWEKNAHEKMAMASTTKIMTAIIALENCELDDTVTVSARAAAAPNVQMNLVPGEEISLRSLLNALMLQSYNDAAVAIAEHIAGSVEAFCGMMTDKAKSLGAVDTCFETPNGLDSESHYSTAYDMALITRYALSNPAFLKIINTRQTSVESSRTTYTLYNKNRLLSEFEGAEGVKTGYTGKAGHCFVGAAKRDGLHLISVVLASGWGARGKEQKWVDTKRVLSYGFGSYAFENIVTEGEEAGFVWVDRSKTDQIGLHFAEGLYLPLNENERGSIVVKTDLPNIVKAPVEKGTRVGTAKIYINGELEAEIDILTADSAIRHDLKTSLEKVLKSFLEMGTTDGVKLVLPEF